MNLTINSLNRMGKEVIRNDKKSEGYDQCQIWEVHQGTGKSKDKGYKLQKVGKEVC